MSCSWQKKGQFPKGRWGPEIAKFTRKTTKFTKIHFLIKKKQEPHYVVFLLFAIIANFFRYKLNLKILQKKNTKKHMLCTLITIHFLRLFLKKEHQIPHFSRMAEPTKWPIFLIPLLRPPSKKTFRSILRKLEKKKKKRGGMFSVSSTLEWTARLDFFRDLQGEN